MQTRRAHGCDVMRREHFGDLALFVAVDAGSDRDCGVEGVDCLGVDVDVDA